MSRSAHALSFAIRGKLPVRGNEPILGSRNSVLVPVCSLYAGMSPVLTWTSSNPPGKLPVRGDEPAELRYHLSIMAQPSLYVGMDFILEFYA